MKKIFAALLLFSLSLCLFSCEGENAYEIYEKALESTSEMSYQKFDLSVRSTVFSGGEEREKSNKTLFKFIREDGNISFYCERYISVTNETSTVSAVLYHHYQDGVMYQTFTTTKMKHELSAEEFDEKYLDLGDLMLKIPESKLQGIKAEENSDDGYTFSVTLFPEELEESEQKKLSTILNAYCKERFDGDHAFVDQMTVKVNTTFDGYFDSYSLLFSAIGEIGGVDARQQIELDAKIINPDSHFVIGKLADTSEYTEGSFEIG